MVRIAVVGGECCNYTGAHTEKLQRGRAFCNFQKLNIRMQTFQLVNWELGISNRFGATNTTLPSNI